MKEDKVKKLVREMMEDHQKDIKEIKRAIGYEYEDIDLDDIIFYCFKRFLPPQVSMTEAINKICEHLGIELIKTKSKSVVNIIKKKK